MAKFKVAMIADRFLEVKPGEFLVIMHQGHPVCSFGRNVRDNEMYEYMNVLSSHKIDDHYRNVIMQQEWAIDESEITLEFCSYDLLIALLRRRIKSEISDLLADREERDEYDKQARSTFNSIRKKVAEAGGRIVKTDFHEEYAMLLGAVSSDEDYYYVLINEKYEIVLESCVGKFGDVVPTWPKSMNRFLKDNVSMKTSDRVMQALKLRFLDSPDVFFTPIYFNFQGKYDKSYLESMSILYSPE